MSEKKHDPEDRSSSEWLDGLFRMSGRTWEEVKAERREQIGKALGVPSPMIGGRPPATGGRPPVKGGGEAEKRVLGGDWLDQGVEVTPPDQDLGKPDWVSPDQVTPDDDGNVTITMRPKPVEEERTIPPAPERVVVHLVNGEKQATEVVWVGTSLTGIEMWEVTARFRYEDIKKITIELLPAKSQIHIGGTGGP